MKTLLKYLVAAAVAAGLASGSAYAIQITSGYPVLVLQSNFGTPAQITEVIYDQNTVASGGSPLTFGVDGNMTAGAVAWSGAVGNWRVASGMGQALPVLGTSSSPNIDLTFNGTSDVLGSTLDITFEGTGYNFSGSLLDVLSVTAASGGNVLDKVFVIHAEGQMEFYTQMGPFGSGNWQQTGALLTLIPSDVLAIQVRLTSNGSGGTISGDKNILAAPEGGTTALLLGLGLLGVGLVARRRAKSAKA